MNRNKARPCDECLKINTFLCPNSSECFSTEDKPHFRNGIMLLKENKQLQNNWNELKNIIKQDIRQCEELIEMCPKELRNTIIGTRSYEEIIGCNKHILSKMQELEQGKDE